MVTIALMLDPVNAWEELAEARLLEFLDYRTQWNRALWNPGLVLLLREILESSESAQASILSFETLGYVVESAKRAAPVDPGVGDRSRLKALQEALQPKMRFQGLEYFALEQLIERIEGEYLALWADYLPNPPAAPNPERIARAIASHQLDNGFNRDYLHRWWTYRLRYETPRRPLAELVREAYALQARGAKSLRHSWCLTAYRPRALEYRAAGWTQHRYR